MKNASAHGLAPAYKQEQFISTGTGQIEAQLLAQLGALIAAPDTAALEAPIETGSSFKGDCIDDAGGSYITGDGNFITRLKGTAVEVEADGTFYQVDGVIGSFCGFLRSDVGIDYNHFAGTLINTGVISGKGNAIQQSSAYSGAVTLNITNSGLIYSKHDIAVDTALNKTLISNSSFIGGETGAIRLLQTDAGDLTEFSSGIYNQGTILAGGTAVHVHNSTGVSSFLTISNAGGHIVTMDPKNAYSVLVDDATTRVEFVNTGGVIVGNVAMKGAGGFLYNDNATIYGDVTIGRAEDTENNQEIANYGFGRIEGNITLIGQINSLSFFDGSVVKGNVHATSSFITGLYLNTGAEIFGNITIDNADDLEESYVLFEVATGSEIPGGTVHGDVSIQSRDVFFTSASTGEIAGNVSIQGSGFVDVANSGEIGGNLSVQGVNAFAFNEGNIFGSVTFENSFSADFNNTGHITGNVTWNSELGSFFNSGTVTGDIHVGDTIMNGSNDGGLINGSIHMGASASRFNNDGGIVSGNVFMGIGNNTFSNYGGDVHGVVYGEAGDNEYFSGMNADTFVSGTGADQFFILWAGPQGTGEDLKYENNGHDTFKDFAIGDDSFAFLYDGDVYDTAETSVIEVAEAVRAAGGDYDFSFDSETETLILILEFEGGGQFDVVFDDRSVDTFLAGQSDLAPFEYMMM